MKPTPADLLPLKDFTTRARPGARSPMVLLAIVGELLFRGVERYRPRDVDGRPGNETFCNIFAQDVAQAMGVALPRNQRANDLVDWLRSPGAVERWGVVDTAKALDLAAEGELVLAVWKNTTGGPGHVAVVLPPLPEEPGVWVAQAGAVNATRMRLEHAFGNRPVEFFGPI